MIPNTTTTTATIADPDIGTPTAQKSVRPDEKAAGSCNTSKRSEGYAIEPHRHGAIMRIRYREGSLSRHTCRLCQPHSRING